MKSVAAPSSHNTDCWLLLLQHHDESLAKAAVDIVIDEGKVNRMTWTIIMFIGLQIKMKVQLNK
jgi:hypothetical protein